MGGWPFFDLEIRTPRLTLRVPHDRTLEALADVAVRGIHGPDRLPFNTPWSVAPPADVRRGLYQWVWRSRAELTADHWRIPFAVFEADTDRVVGTQDVFADRFPLLRTFGTGSWLGLAHQGRGIGKEMRAAVLHFGFAGLAAERATTGAWEDNPASQRVTSALGYEPNGVTVLPRPRLQDGQPGEDEPVRELLYALNRERWEQQRRDDIEIVGLEPCLALLGLATEST